MPAKAGIYSSTFLSEARKKTIDFVINLFYFYSMSNRSKENYKLGLALVAFAGACALGFTASTSLDRDAYDATVAACKRGERPETPKTSPLLRTDPNTKGVIRALGEDPNCSVNYTPRSKRQP